MAVSVPTTRSVNWVFLVPMLAMTFVVLLVCLAAFGDRGVWIGLILWIGYSLLSKELFAKHHRRGIRLIRRGVFEQAIDCFDRSYDFFTRHPWLDRWRCLVMLSASRASYCEMALCNKAFCLAQIGEGDAALSVYRQCDAEFPHGMASYAVRMLESRDQRAADSRST